MMNNAVKALVIAGGMLISVLVISICMYLYTSFKDAYANQINLHDTLEIENFNSVFNQISASEASPATIKGYQAYNLVGKIAEINANEDALTQVTLLGSLNESNYRQTTFYYTESLMADYTYWYSYNVDGLIDTVFINPK